MKVEDLAPIVLFVYNRPWHTQQVLDALSENHLSENSILYIFCDGKMTDATFQDLLQIEQVRSIVQKENRFLKTIITTQEENKGLANSIIDGVSEVIKKHGKVIVLEDDILPSRGFLKYMNDALQIYNSDSEVGCIHAWNYHFDTIDNQQSTFFLKGADCWGWATWERAWLLFNKDANYLLTEIKKSDSTFEFDRRGTHDYTAMLQNQIDGKVNSWAIRWHASLFIRNKYCLQPTRPMVKNIGFDVSGVHCGLINIEQHPIEAIIVDRIEIKESDSFFKLYSNMLKKEKKHNLRTRIVNKIKSIFTA